jgi:hypothetical protein
MVGGVEHFCVWQIPKQRSHSGQLKLNVIKKWFPELCNQASRKKVRFATPREPNLVASEL